ncbi:MAG: DUF1902 domain-containing protein [Alphaproteobacteria bacterium]|nr:DUF1902 domain-containing protein [Alphaproteobacteria bacterium]
MAKQVVVHATWDPDACVWVALSDDVPGLATEADTMERLLEKLRVMVPELLEENRGTISEDVAEVPLVVKTRREETISLRRLG